jgi:succinate dehydrogenase / fumarate reductase flavoprotein subunit
MMRQVGLGNVEIFPRSDVQDIVVIDGRARGIVLRDMVSGKIESYIADAVILATGGYGNVFYLSTNAKGCNATAIWRAHKKGALFANPCFTQIHPTCIPVSGSYQSKLTLMSESLRNDGRIWVPNDPKDKRPPNEIPESERDYFLERKYPSFGNLVPRDVASRNAKEMIDDGKGVGLTGKAVYLDFAEAIQRLGKDAITEKYGNLFEMYEQITNEDPYKVPMRIYPASHYTMGGLWVDYNLMTTIPGLFALGECNFSDHGANRLGASALMQGLADGYFIISYSISDYLAQSKKDKLTIDAPEFKQAEKDVSDKINRLLNINGSKTVDELHRELGMVMWDYVGMSRNAEGLTKAKKMIKDIREDFWKNVKIIGTNEEINQSLEKAARVADFLELGELMAEDALQRNESCGGHFREESQTEENEAKRDDENFSHVAAWEYKSADQPEIMHKEQLQFEFVKPSQRSYK